MSDRAKTNRRLPVAAACLAAVLLIFLSFKNADSVSGATQLQHDAVALDKPRPVCPGPVLKPDERQEPWNKKFSKKLNEEVAVKDANKGCELVFYGDSITETWRATDGGRACPRSRCAGVPEVFQRYFGHFSTSVLAVGGDQAMHLLYRLQHGQVYKKHQPKLALVMIGTNDLGAASCLGGEAAILQSAAGTVDRIIQNVQYLLDENPATHILVMGLLPRGSWENPEDMFKLPSDFSSAIYAVNHALDRYAFGNKHTHFIDCTKHFVQGGKLSPELMPDALHPNAAGMALLAECILPFVKLYGGAGMQA
ncbi:platelet-activating factor acetyltransferase activity protein [Trebouxia sp. C0010 RCD-2024]